ncbi:MAG: PHP domain-containing protein [bacterium]|nr:PHP domain-containing protein [bacterium]
MIGEMHCHTRLSRARWVHRELPTPFELIDYAANAKLDFLAITDHDSQEAYELAKSYARQKGIVLVPSVEVTTRSNRLSRRRTHILAYGVENRIPSRMSVKETIAAIHAAGGIAVVAHPFCSRYGKVLYIGHQVGDYAFDAVEVFNSDELPLDNMRAQALALVLDLPGIGGSDAHTLINIGNTCVSVDIPKTDDWRVIVQAIRDRKHTITGKVYNSLKERQSTVKLLKTTFIPLHLHKD